MEIEEAIEILDDIKDTSIDAGHYEAEEAIELGIEALGEILLIRQAISTGAWRKLPGETED